MTDVFLFGATSMNGWSVVRRHGPSLTAFCNPYFRDPRCEDWPRLKLEDEAALRALFSAHTPRVLIHCGGICDVGKCEQHPDFAQLLNVRSVELLLHYLPTSTRLVYCSSDHVFGAGLGRHDEATEPAPLSVYGRSRVSAENLVRRQRPESLIIRSGLGIGPSIGGTTGHLDWLQSRHRRGLPMTIIEDEVRSAVWAEDLADRMWDLAMSSRVGTQHIVARSGVSRGVLANYLCARFSIRAAFNIERRADSKLPHIGNVTLSTKHTGALAAPLPAVVPN